jgi:hypothetical protein
MVLKRRIASRRGGIIALAASAAVLLVAGGVIGGLRPWPHVRALGSQLIAAVRPEPIRKPANYHLSVVLHESGEQIEVPDLKAALQYAGPGNIDIVLHDRGPVRLEAAEALVVPAGVVTIRAAEQCRPELIVDLPGAQPFLRVKPRAVLKLVGLAIRAEYPGHAAKPPPVIEASGSLELRRCSFQTTSSASATQAVSAEGLRLHVSECLFQGFEQCLNVGAFAGVEVVLENCMLIHNPRSSPLRGWAVRVRHEPSPATGDPRRLILRRCTVWDACLLRAEDFTPDLPLTVSIEQTAVRAVVLLGWKSDTELAERRLHWSGRNNLYDVGDAVWELRPGGNSAALRRRIAWHDWSKMIDEQASRAQSIPVPNPSSPSFEAFRQLVFPPQDPAGVAIGADPLAVGPPG